MDLHAVIEKNGAETMIALIRILSYGRLATLYRKLAVIRSCGGSRELGFSPDGYPDKPLVSYRSNRHLSCLFTDTLVPRCVKDLVEEQLFAQTLLPFSAK